MMIHTIDVLVILDQTHVLHEDVKIHIEAKVENKHW